MITLQKVGHGKDGRAPGAWGFMKRAGTWNWCFMERAGAWNMCFSQRAGAEDLCFSQGVGAEDLCFSQRASAENLCCVGLSTTIMSPAILGVSDKKQALLKCPCPC